MERISLEKVLNNAKSGRAISPAGIRNAASGLLALKVNDLVTPCSEEDGPAWADEFCSLANLPDGEIPYIKAVRHINMQLDSTVPTLISDLFMFISSLGFLGSDTVKQWTGLCAEDALREAGMQEEFEIWLSGDAGEWEREKGRAPSIRDILMACFDAFDETGVEDLNICSVDMSDGLADIVKDNDHSAPFERSADVMGLENFDDDIQEDFKAGYSMLICKWIWLVMVEAPYKVCMRHD